MFDALGEAGAGGGVGLVVVEALEGSLAAEKAGLREGEEAPEVEEAIFDGRAGEDEAVGRARAAWAVALAGFLMFWPSSRMTASHDSAAKASA
jgi:hypothetical protein